MGKTGQCLTHHSTRTGAIKPRQPVNSDVRLQGECLRCFNHQTDAIGICKHCQRALCSECCTDLGDGLACKGVHEEEVKHLNSLIQNTKQAYSASPKASLFGPSFNIFMGLVFTYFGFQNGLNNFLFIIGVGFVLYGVATLIYNTKYFKKVTTNYEV